MAETALVTGASGFIGGHVARRLALEGLAVRAMVRDLSRRRVMDLGLPGIEIVQADLTDLASLRRAAEGADLIVHAAADTALRSPETVRAVTVEGTRQMLLAAQGAGARAFVHLSSIAVYGGSARGDEEALLAPYGDRYGDAKIGAERALGEAADGSCRVAILRPPAVYGPGSSLWTATFARLVAHGLPACLDGGRTLLPYVYVENLVDAVVLAFRGAGEWGRGGGGERASGRAGEEDAGTRGRGAVRAYNILDGITTWADYLGYFAAAYGRPVRSMPSWPLELVARCAELVDALGGPRARLNRAGLRFLTLRSLPGYTAERAERELGWHPRVDLAEGMRGALAWLEGEGRVPGVAEK